MIGLLKGKIEKIMLDKGSLILNVHNVGYVVHTTTSVLLGSKLGGEVTLYTHMAVRETALDLYGFTQESEKELFELLLSVSGVGPKSALSILSIADEGAIYAAVSANETSYLTKVSGIGKKLASKIVLELKDKIGASASADNNINSEDASVLDALESMGYKKHEAREAVKNIPDSEEGLNARITAALKSLSK